MKFCCYNALHDRSQAIHRRKPQKPRQCNPHELLTSRNNFAHIIPQGDNGNKPVNAVILVIGDDDKMCD